MTRLRIVVSVLLAVTFLFVNSCAAFAQIPAADTSNKRQLIVVGLPDQVPATWFNTDASLLKVKNGTQFTLLSPTSKLFTDRYQATLGSNFPIVALLRPDGGAIYAADKNSLPSTAGGLFNEMRSAANLARNAQPINNPPATIEVPPQLMESNTADPYCIDGQCPPQQGGTILPMLRPNRDTDVDPLDLVERVPRPWWMRLGSTSALVIGGIAICVILMLLFLAGLTFLVILNWFLSRK